MPGYLNLSTRAKLFTAFGLMGLFAAITIVFAWQAMESMRESQRRLFQVELANVADLKDLRMQHHAVRANLAQIMLAPGDAQAQWLRDRTLERHRQAQAELRAVLARGGAIQDKRDLLREVETIQATSIDTRESQLLPLIAAGRTEQARQVFMGVQAERDRRLGAITDELVDHSVRAAAASVRASEREAADATRMLVAIALLALATGVALAVLLARVIAGPLQVLSQAAERVAAGDLDVQLPQDGRKDEPGVLTRTFGHMVGRLREMMREIGDGVSVLASSASEITAATGQVAASSAQTAAAVAQTSATAEQVKQTARVASEKAAQVQDAAQRTVHVSQSGLQAMEDSIAAMHQIRQQMDSVAQSILRLAEQGVAIGEIIATVNDLADQSNLLSVNAAIEAARAGEEGAGFRVVAQEIRNLAEQSKQATVQVRGMLGEVQKATGTAVMTAEEAGKAVRAGVEQSEAAARAIRSMAESITESAHAAAQIAASAQQQAVGMDQVAYAMQNINQASAQNVAASRQTEAAAHGLQNLGQRLQALVQQYQH